ncbi:MAG: hypothetical protein E7089_05380 [Bacteroidales bacterium]|nr:hypothetical protein [Bacteroidales bacterium]
MSLLDFFEKILPESWFGDVRTNYGDILSDELIMDSVQNASTFFNIEDPMLVVEYTTTGVLPNDDVSTNDDILVFSREQLVDLGITGKDGLDLVMTHECTHRMLQGMDHLNLSSHQEELCCDFMAGVRAGLSGIDVSQMENSLIHTSESETHPAGCNRVNSIEAGIKFAQEYYAVHEVAPTFNDCLDNFCKNVTDIAQNGAISLRTEDISAYTNAGETIGSVAFVDNNFDENNATIKEYTSDEIKRNITKADSERRYHEGMVSHHTYMAKHGLSEADTKYHLSEAGKHQRSADEWKSKAQKWRWTKPDTK